MAMVRVRDGEPIERALKRFKKAVDDEGILKDLRKREYFVKPSMRKRLAQIEQNKKHARLRRKQEEYDRKNDNKITFGGDYSSKFKKR